ETTTKTPINVGLQINSLVNMFKLPETDPKRSVQNAAQASERNVVQDISIKITFPKSNCDSCISGLNCFYLLNISVVLDYGQSILVIRIM
ncbi:hypothetical protein L9F63_008241, partial [Diploptera punctata]